MNDNVPSLRYLHAVQSKDFADPPADAVAHHGPAQSLLYADPEARVSEAARAREDREVRAPAPRPAAIDGLEVAPAQKPRRAGEAESRGIRWA